MCLYNAEKSDSEFTSGQGIRIKCELNFREEKKDCKRNHSTSTIHKILICFHLMYHVAQFQTHTTERKQESSIKNIDS